MPDDGGRSLDVRHERSEFIALLAAAAAWPLTARAQQEGKLRRVGFMWDSPKAFHDALEAFRSGLRELGYV